ncbi:MAG: hypothetical protein WC955_03850 [Elusimicrobiota bacterium]
MKLKVRQAYEKDIYRDTIRIPEQHRLDQRGTLITEGTVCQVKVNSKKIYAILRGDNNNSAAELKIDERLRNRLGLNINDDVDFVLIKSGFWGEFMWAWDASDPAYRVSARLGLSSVLLGILALCISLVQFFVPIFKMITKP